MIESNMRRAARPRSTPGARPHQKRQMGECSIRKGGIRQIPIEVKTIYRTGYKQPA